MVERVITYAQNREDVILSAFFLNQTGGFYVDVGAYDPVKDSVTKYFYDRGWAGVNIEPNPNLFKQLVRGRPNDINLNLGVSNKKAKLKFREYNEGQGLSTFSEEIKKELTKEPGPYGAKYKDYEVAVDRLDNILDSLGTKAEHIDFIKIDVEGYEYEVIESNNWERYRPKVICIEANHIIKDWPSLLIKNDYKKVFNDGLNDYYVDKKRKDVPFDYIAAALGRDVMPAYASHAIDKLELDRRRLKEQVIILRNQIVDAQDNIGRLNSYIAHHARLRILVKDLIIKIHNIVLTHILNHLKTYKRYPEIDISMEESDPLKILHSMKEADVNVSRQTPTIGRKLIRLFVLAIYYLYRTVTRSLGYIVRATMKLGRKKAA